MNMRRTIPLVLAPLLVLAAACGDDDDDTASETTTAGTERRPPPTPEGTAADTTTGGSDAPADTGGGGGGAITVGSADFPESQLLAQIYGQALAEAGFDVSYELAIGAREVYFDAVESGEVDLVPEYTNSLLSFVIRQDDPNALPDGDERRGAGRRARRGAARGPRGAHARRPPRTRTSSSARRRSPRSTR